jgi:predicted alpha/beta superfamily hydrolase
VTLTTHVFTRSRFGVAGRAVRVWLPSGYDERAAQRYPVLYLMDGQNLFEAETAFAGVAWRAGETAQKLIDARRIEPLLLVGVDNSGAHRTDDYTPVRWQGRGGAADDFGRMLTDEIKPFVDAHYRTRPDRASTGIAGASLGGLFALHLALSREDLFARAAALSPTIWWGHGAILRRIAALPQRPDLRLWIDIGKREAPPLRQQVQRAEQLLLAKGWLAHRNARKATLRHAEIARGGHDERSWGKRFDRVLKFLFPPAKAASRPRRRGKAPRAP